MAAVAGAVFAAGLLAVTALGRGSDSPSIVIDQSIGDVSIGESQADVEAAYGTPAESLAITLRGGGTGLLVRYDINGGSLIVTYADGHVVSIETDSSFYRTSAGIGPGTSKAGLGGFHHDFCSLGLWDGTAAIPPDGVVTVFQTSGDIVSNVTITVLGYYDLCEGAPPDQEVPDPRPSSVTLTVQIDPDGAGYVRSDPYFVDCPTKCVVSYGRGAVVTLSATPTNGFTFEGWSGACTGAEACVVAMEDARTVVAHFSGRYVPPPPPPTPDTTSSQTTTAPTTTGND